MLKPGQVSIRRACPADRALGYGWVANYKEAGKRRRRKFETKTAAEDWAEEWQVEVDEGGSQATLKPDERAAIVAMLPTIRESSFEIREIVEAGLTTLRKRQRSGTIAELVKKRLETMRREGCSANHLSGSKTRLNRFATQFAERKVAEIDRDEIDDFLAELSEFGADTVRNYRTSLHALFEEGRKSRLCDANPVADSYRPKTHEREIGIFTPAQASALLSQASDEFLPVLAISLFAGLRASEIQKLRWGDVDTVRRFIRVGGLTKTKGSRRLVEMSENLALWLDSIPRLDPGRPRVHETKFGWRVEYWRDRTRKALSFPAKDSSDPKSQAEEAARRLAAEPSGFEGLLVRNTEHFEDMRQELARAVSFPWSKNGLRHSFASYHLAFHQNAPLLAEQMGNSVEVVRRHYAELVHRQEAEIFWKIVPEASLSVVQIS